MIDKHPDSFRRMYEDVQSSKNPNFVGIVGAHPELVVEAGSQMSLVYHLMEYINKQKERDNNP